MLINSIVIEVKGQTVIIEKGAVVCSGTTLEYEWDPNDKQKNNETTRKLAIAVFGVVEKPPVIPGEISRTEPDCNFPQSLKFVELFQLINE